MIPFLFFNRKVEIVNDFYSWVYKKLISCTMYYIAML